MFSVLSMIVIALYFWVFVFLVSLNKIDCPCAINWRRDYIIGFIGFVFLLNLFLLLINNTKAHAGVLFAMVIVFAAVLNMILMIQYARDINKDKCACADTLSVNIMTFLAVFQIVTIVLSTVVSMFVLAKKI